MALSQYGVRHGPIHRPYLGCYLEFGAHKRLLRFGVACP